MKKNEKFIKGEYHSIISKWILKGDIKKGNDKNEG
jgi:hypothetical protein